MEHKVPEKDVGRGGGEMTDSPEGMSKVGKRLIKAAKEAADIAKGADRFDEQAWEIAKRHGGSIEAVEEGSLQEAIATALEVEAMVSQLKAAAEKARVFRAVAEALEFQANAIRTGEYRK